MIAINNIIDRFKIMKDKPAVIWENNSYCYNEILSQISYWEHALKKKGVQRGSICAFNGDYSPKVCALIFALMRMKAIIVPLSDEVESSKINLFIKIAEVDFLIDNITEDNFNIQKQTVKHDNNLIKTFLSKKTPGLIVFTSGSTGEPKGILHDCEQVMQKFVDTRKGWRTVLFLLIDHFGGFNTLLSSFAYGGTAVCIPNRKPDVICQIIEQTNADLLPTTPTFINILIASRSYLKYNLSSIKLITYGTEVMPDSTLIKLKEIFPNARLKQTYGLSELGVLRSKSESDNSVWVKVGGSGFETKIINGYLWVKSQSNMVGYLNAPNPINEQGWMNTGDQVEKKGDYIRILGRKSEMINIGGQKVFPIEIETILLEINNILDATVYGEKNPIMGKVLHADISIVEPEDKKPLINRIRKYCSDKLPKWKTPVKFNIVSNKRQINERYKKKRIKK